MPEPLSILATVVGTLTLLLKGREVLETIMKDVSNYKYHDQTMRSHIAQLVLLQHTIEDWKLLWRISDRFEDTFHNLLWGRQGHQDLTAFAYNVKDLALKVQSEIQSIYKVPSSPSPTLASRITVPSPPEKEGEPDGLKLPRLSKVRNSVLKTEILEKRLEDLTKGVERLQHLAIRTLAVQHHLHISSDKLDGLDQWIDEFHTDSFLTELENNSHQHSQLLVREVVHIERAELCLDGLIREPLKGETVDMQVDNLPSIVYNLRFQKRSVNKTFKFVVLAVSDEAVGEFCIVPKYGRGFQHIGNAEACGCSRGNCGRLFQLRADYGHRLGLTRFFETRYLQEVQEQPVSLRKVLYQRRNQFVDKFHGRFARTEKTSLAYLLARYTFIMLRTGTIQKLCTCSVLCEPDSRNDKYRISIGSKLTHDDLNGSVERVRVLPWCEHEFRDTPIRQLGVLLTEIAISQPIQFAKLDDHANTIELGMCHQDGDAQYVQSLFLEDIVELVRWKAGSLYAQSVEWCLNEGRRFSENPRSTLGTFYENVLKP